MSRYLLIAAGSIFALAGILHAIFTIVGKLTPIDHDVAARMRATSLRLSPRHTNAWSAWLGFNFSHSLGLILFGVICIMTATRAVIPFLAVVAAIYLVLAIRFWFYAPAVAIAIATLCLALAWLFW